MAGIINSAQSATPSVADQINSAYQTNFGRPAEAAGVAYWSDIAQKNPNANLSDLIAANAGTQDKSAESSISAGNANTAGTWGSGLNENGVASGQTYWDSNAGKWSANNPAAVTSTGYVPTQQAPAVSSPITQRVVDPAKETVAGQVQGIINANSPLMQQAQATALQRANDRGLGNSSLAVGAAQDALYNAAMPIATSDANVYGNASNLNTTTQNQFTAAKDAAQNQINSTNTAATNNAAQFGANASNTASLAQLQASTQRIMNDASLSTSEKNAQLSAATQSTIAANNNISAQTIASLNTTSQQAIAQMDEANRQILQTDASAASLHAQAMQTIAGIEGNPNISDKAGAVNQVLQTLHNSLSVMGIVGQDLNFTGTADTTTAAQTQAATNTAPEDRAST